MYLRKEKQGLLALVIPILDKLIYWNDVTLLNFLFGGANGQAPDDHDGGEDERDHDQTGSAIEQNADQDVLSRFPKVIFARVRKKLCQMWNAARVSNCGLPLFLLNGEQGLVDANDQNADQDGGANDQNADQDGGANDQNAYQDDGANDQDGGANDQNADQDGGTNDQNADQDGDINRQVPNEQNLGATEQNAVQDGDADEQGPNDQDAGANEQNTDPDGDTNEQDMGATEKNADQDGNTNEQIPNEQDVGSTLQNADQDGNANERGPNEQDMAAAPPPPTHPVNSHTWGLRRVASPASEYFIAGRFFMKLDELMYQNGVTLHDALFEVTNVQAPNDQNGGVNGHEHDLAVGANADQDGGADNQVGGANADQDGSATADQIACKLFVLENHTR
ncbi:hypothetical protein CQW23_15937 [Capsicum baccatum]|uniref:Uncharacterized protein n=1 Tax=Capsicum baccatum TaxID=33114 RepID=A0A2G2WNM7_CAPBA|nr:hypothetical protein CQW23_15937 [Capsicum baccatum]